VPQPRSQSRPSAGFPPIARADARVLILGSLPGVASIEAQQYYAQPRNAFWRIMGELIGAGPDLDYPSRLARLEHKQVALWDVAAMAVRPGSLDAAIVGSSVKPNDFASLYARCRSIELILFNGAKAAELYRRWVLPGLAPAHAAIATRRLPSTSPAHAGMPYSQKLDAWRIVAGPLT
jgi:hypoxanthine-DNA glycosylase